MLFKSSFCSKCTHKISEPSYCCHNTAIYHAACCFICQHQTNSKTDDRASNSDRKCSHCACLLADKIVYHKQDPEQSSSLFCSDCFGRIASDKCSQCFNLIELSDNEIELDNGLRYHLECFVCFNCQKGLDHMSQKIYLNEGQKPCCSDCYDKLNRHVCSKCLKHIRADQTGISYANNQKSFHSDCFTCHRCSKNLICHGEKTKFYRDISTDNNPLCQACFEKFNCRKCKKCNNLLTNKMVKFENDEFYHRDCFGCFNCHKNFIDSNLNDIKRDKKSRLMCSECHGKKCLKCNEFVLATQSSVKFEGKHDYHRDCFCCSKCCKKLIARSDSIQSDDIIYFKNPVDSTPVCLECYESFFSEKCSKCDRAIKMNHKKINHEESVFHSQCFVCSKCCAKMTPQTESIKKDANNNLLCHKCAKRNEKTPPRAKAGPGKLNFGQIGAFEKKANFSCSNCKKLIQGQKYLTNRVGEFLCKECNQKLNEASCFMCLKVFESREEFFKDDQTNHNYCSKCFKIFREQIDE